MGLRIVADFEELNGLIGQEIGVGDWFEVSQRLIDSFAELIHDPQWIHIDPVRAQLESPYGTTVAHGFLTVSLLSYLHRDLIEFRGDYTRSINYGFNRLRFPAAVPAGSRVRLRSKLQAVEEIEGGLQCIWNVTIEIEGQPKPALVAEWIGRLYR